jgi:hypothetical protein
MVSGVSPTRKENQKKTKHQKNKKGMVWVYAFANAWALSKREVADLR